MTDEQTGSLTRTFTTLHEPCRSTRARRLVPPGAPVDAAAMALRTLGGRSCRLCGRTDSHLHPRPIEPRPAPPPAPVDDELAQIRATVQRLLIRPVRGRRGPGAGQLQLWSD
jgi:hypothetical protein